MDPNNASPTISEAVLYQIPITNHLFSKHCFPSYILPSSGYIQGYQITYDKLTSRVNDIYVELLENSAIAINITSQSPLCMPSFAAVAL
jgi:hypothetical protein